MGASWLPKTIGSFHADSDTALPHVLVMARTMLLMLSACACMDVRSPNGVIRVPTSTAATHSSNLAAYRWKCTKVEPSEATSITSARSQRPWLSQQSTRCPTRGVAPDTNTCAPCGARRVESRAIHSSHLLDQKWKCTSTCNTANTVAERAHV